MTKRFVNSLNLSILLFASFAYLASCGRAKPPNSMDNLVTIYQQTITGKQKSWVLFENGTCVILMNPETDLKQQAIELLRQWGPVHAGSPAGDFTVSHLSNYPGYMVYGHHPDVIVYVSPVDAGPSASDVTIGLLGRARRDQDGHSLKVIHVEDRRLENGLNQ